MQLKRMAFVAGMTVAATAGLASQAWAAPADTSVSERQCFDGDGRVQREADGVGTCVGGTNDGLLIDDGVDHTDDASGTSSSRYGSDSDADSDADGDSDSDSGYGDRGYRSDDSDATSRSDRDDSSDGDRYARDDSDDSDREAGRGSSPAAAYRF